MTDESQQQGWATTFYQDLTSLVNHSFPKKCPSCGTEYRDADAFLAKTHPVRNLRLQETSGLFELHPDKDSGVGLFRNCRCGSTLMADFQSRRDSSPEGKRRREQFNHLLEMLTDKGIKDTTARTELLKVLRGESSDIIQHLIDEKDLPR